MRPQRLFLPLLLLISACRPNVIGYEDAQGYKLVHQTEGPTLGYTTTPILEKNGYAFKDLNRNGALDVPRDMECYRDSRGNVYDFAFGLNWNGVIDDERVKKYR